MADDKKFELSRRKVLGSIGTVGVASAAAGAGTMAFFNDTESTGKNTVTAGTLDLEMNWKATADQGQNIQNSPYDGGAGQSFVLGDVKPGDSGSIKVCFEPKSNPAWIWLKGTLVANSEGENTEPEREAEGGDVGDYGELANKTEATLKYKGGAEITSGSMAEVLHFINSGGNGVLLDADDPTDNSTAPFEEGTEQCVVLNWEVPTDVGNVIQGDEMKLSMSLYAEQARHNRDVANLTSDF